MLISFAILMGSICLFTQGCIWSKRTLEVVHSCPTNKEETTKAARIKGCDVIAFRQNCTNPIKFKYHCLYSYIEKSLVEVCAIETIIHGVCIVYDERLSNIQPIYNVRCRDISSPCPEKYLSTEGHLYATCPALINLTFFDTRDPKSPEPPENQSQIVMILVVSFTIVIISSIILLAIIRKKMCWRKSEDHTRQDSTEELEPLNIPENERNESNQHGAENNPVGGNYRWRTSISDQFSKLTDDEVSMLFCFLCSDSGPPDFTDTEWLDLLNVIRQRVYNNKNPVTREKAQQTLEKLKSSDFLFEDPDIKITKDTTDETMCRIASLNQYIPFYYSSYDTASMYLRSGGYNRKPGERCVVSNLNSNEALMIRRLQMNILTHVTMEDINIFDSVYQTLGVSKNIQRESRDNREEFLIKLREEGEAVHYRGRLRDSVDHVTWLWGYGLSARPDIVRSCIGLHPHWDIYTIDNKPYKKTNKYHEYTEDNRSVLYSLLLCDKYTADVNGEAFMSILIKIRERYYQKMSQSDDIDVIFSQDDVKETQNGAKTFISDDIRHDVMYAFVTECLVEDNDLEFFLTTASRDVISEYCRSWKYKRSEGERCLYIPDKPKEMYEFFIDKLQVDIITHSTMSDGEIHNRISKRLNIPKEILLWPLNSRTRFVENSKRGRVGMFRARGMIVGCAGAGKTTLLRNLPKKKGTLGNRTTETTVGLEVHEDMFKIEDNTLMDISAEEIEVVSGLQSGEELISMTDFAGQVAYYACHQVYLSRRAFYIIVIDMSKGLNEKVLKYNVDRHNPQGSLFHTWTYKDFFHFWLQTIKTYCDEENTQGKESYERRKGCFHPVIIVASHKDKKFFGSKNFSFYEQLEKCLSEKQTLKELISFGKYFEVECPPKTLTLQQEKKLEQLRKCIVDTVKQLPQWGEQLPLKWAQLEEFLRLQKKEGVKVITRKEFKAIVKIDLSDDDDLNDALRFFHEIGQIIYFSEGKMKDVIIVNVQWFVDGFKYIITDETHLARKNCSSTLNKTGKITGKEMEQVWRNVAADNSYIHHKHEILPYLDKLGLMTNVQSKDKDADDELYYIPSMNRIDLAKEYEEAISRGQKTSMILLHFKTYLPHFFFFRLVVKCLNKWKALNMEMFCKNAAFYKVDDGSHYIVIAVSKTSIQLQVFTPVKEIDLQTECVMKIRETVESLIHDITQTFHRQTKYEIGYTCKDINITEEDEEFFLSEAEVISLKAETGRRPCPKHVIGKQIHTIDRNRILRFWRKEDTASSPRDNHKTIDEPQLEADP